MLDLARRRTRDGAARGLGEGGVASRRSARGRRRRRRAPGSGRGARTSRPTPFERSMRPTQSTYGRVTPRARTAPDRRAEAGRGPSPRHGRARPPTPKRSRASSRSSGVREIRARAASKPAGTPTGAPAARVERRDQQGPVGDRGDAVGGGAVEVGHERDRVVGVPVVAQVLQQAGGVRALGVHPPAAERRVLGRRVGPGAEGVEAATSRVRATGKRRTATPSTTCSPGG